MLRSISSQRWFANRPLASRVTKSPVVELKSSKALQYGNCNRVGIRRGSKDQQASLDFPSAVPYHHQQNPTLQSVSQSGRIYPQDYVIAPVNSGSQPLRKQDRLPAVSKVTRRRVEVRRRGASNTECNRKVGIRRGIVKTTKRRLDFCQVP